MKLNISWMQRNYSVEPSQNPNAWRISKPQTPNPNPKFLFTVEWCTYQTFSSSTLARISVLASAISWRIACIQALPESRVQVAIVQWYSGRRVDNWRGRINDRQGEKVGGRKLSPSVEDGRYGAALPLHQTLQVFLEADFKPHIVVLEEHNTQTQTTHATATHLPITSKSQHQQSNRHLYPAICHEINIPISH